MRRRLGLAVLILAGLAGYAGQAWLAARFGTF